MADDSSPQIAGPNAWLVDEMYEQYLADPNSVSESWRDFFQDYRPTASPRGGLTAAPAPAPAAPAPAAPATPAATPAAAEPPGTPLRGAAARIVTNMEASLTVPTATSFREVPAKLLEVNRKIINSYLSRTRAGKISFTHVIGYAIVKAITGTTPVMNAAYVEGADGKPYVVRHEHLGLGLAVDVEKGDGSRSLLVPCIKNADTLDFAGFFAAYEELIRKVRSNKLAPDDFAGVTVIAHQPRHHRHRAVGAPPHAGPGPHRGRRLARLPHRLRRRRPHGSRRPRPVEGDDHHLDLRPPHHPGRRVGHVPQARPPAPDG